MSTVSLCTDCTHFAANGWDERMTGRPLPDPAPMSLLPHVLVSGHAHLFDADRDEYMDCEGHVSKYPCHGCGSTLTGVRYCHDTAPCPPGTTGFPHAEQEATCGTCGRTWCARCTPTPASRCPYEAEHEEPSHGETDDEEPASCPACGEYIDFCMGHGPIGDPVGFDILDRHDNDDHSRCHVNGCDVAADELGPIGLEVHPMDGFTLSAMSGNYRIARRYVGYSRTEALRDFRLRLREAGAWS